MKSFIIAIVLLTLVAFSPLVCTGAGNPRSCGPRVSQYRHPAPYYYSRHHTFSHPYGGRYYGGQYHGGQYYPRDYNLYYNYRGITKYGFPREYYSKYYGGFHAREYYRDAYPSGDIGLRGTAW